MRREDLRAIEGMTDAQIDAVMALHGNDVNEWRTQRENAVNQAIAPLNTQINQLSGQVNTLTTQNTELTNQVNGYVNGEKVAKAGVDSKFAKFVISEVNSLVSETTDFDTALAGYVKENPQYMAGSKSVVNTGPALTGGNAQTKTGNEVMNSWILASAGK